MIQALYTGVSGLRANKTALDVISDNIANVNTVGFKASHVSFKDMFYQAVTPAESPRNGAGGINPSQIGMGTGIASISVDLAKGTPETTGKLSDVAIDGSGYLALSDGVSRFFSRDGALTVDSAGNLTQSGSGLKVLGWTSDPISGVVDTTTPITANSGISIPIGRLAIARQTSNVAYGGNLDSNAAAGTTTKVSSEIYDSLGAAHTLTISLTRESALTGQGYAATTATVGTGAFSFSVGGGAAHSITLDATNNTLQGLADAINGVTGGGVTAAVVDGGAAAGANRYQLELTSTTGDVTVDTTGLTAGAGTVPTFSAVTGGRWAWTAGSPDAAGSSTVGSGVIAFDTSGKCITDPGSIALTLGNTQGSASPINAKADFSSMVQFSGETSGRMVSQDGLTNGVLDSFSIDKQGIITGVFNNGMTQTLGQIALAGFANPAGLMRGGNNAMTESINSGTALIGRAGVGSLGSFAAGALESSNVDLPTEFSNMIVAQRAFQANSRIITTADEILTEMMQLKR